MPKKYKARLREYNRNKLKGLERIRQSAQAAFIRAQEEKNKGNLQVALQWMDRAHRLAEHNPNITFDLIILNLKQCKYQKAYNLLIPLMKKFDFFEGWLVLAIILLHQNKNELSVEKINYALSHFCPSQESWRIIKEIVEGTDKEGCCCVIGSMDQVWIYNLNGKPISIFLDNEFILETKDSVVSLPYGWETYSYLSVESQSASLVGSPVDLQSLIRTEGFVEGNNKVVQGWLWYPAEPDRVPTVHIYDEDNILLKEIEPTKEFKVSTLDFPLFRAKKYILPIEEFKSGLYAFKDDYGRHITGSPINPLLLINKDGNKNSEGKSISAYYKNNDFAIPKSISFGTVIIIPIYRGKEETLACIQSVLETLPSGFTVQLVNDCSPDNELIDKLEVLVNLDTIFLIHHLENMGFPGAVNTGMLAWPGYDVILLNSDTLVGNDWAVNLQKAAYSVDNIGTATPFSNDASIFSYPYHDKENPVPSLQSVNNLMQFTQKANPEVVIDVPTAHGFCMFIKQECLFQVGYFQENIFAQGYGEENDFCMRAQHKGWRHVLAASVFVGHKGGVSFQNSKQNLLKRNLAILNQLYPDYDAMVMDYIDQDFLRLVRRDIDVYRLNELEQKQANQGKPLRYELFITHTYGGGVERVVQERANELRLKGIIPLLIRPTLLGNACRLEIQLKSSSTNLNIEEIYPNLVFELPVEYTSLIAFLKERVILKIQIHHFSGHHPIIRNLLTDLKVSYVVYIHDYMSFCPRISLINKKKKYCGEPKELNECQKCIGSDFFDEEKQINIKEWIARSEKELKNAESVIVPSEDTAKRMYLHFPRLKELKIHHLEDDRPDFSIEQLSFFSQKDNYNYKKQLARNSDRFKVCIIGAIGVEKGFNVIQKLVQDADYRDLSLEFVLVGRSVDDRKFLKTDRLFITGTYTEEEAIDLVMEQNADMAFFPAIWPETWCYALSIAWRAGLKTASFDIGTVAQRIKNTQRGWVLSPLMTIPKLNDMLLQLCKDLRCKDKS